MKGSGTQNWEVNERKRAHCQLAGFSTRPWVNKLVHVKQVPLFFWSPWSVAGNPHGEHGCLTFLPYRPVWEISDVASCSPPKIDAPWCCMKQDKVMLLLYLNEGVYEIRIQIFSQNSATFVLGCIRYCSLALFKWSSCLTFLFWFGTFPFCFWCVTTLCLAQLWCALSRWLLSHTAMAMEFLSSQRGSIIRHLGLPAGVRTGDFFTVTLFPLRRRRIRHC